MYNRFLFYLSFLVFLGACSGSEKKHTEAQEQNQPATVNKKKPAASFADTIIITGPAAVFFNPDPVQLLKIKSVTDSMVFASMQHDCFYQQRNARMVLTKFYPDIKITEINKARYLLFKLPGGPEKLIDLDSNNDPCGIYLFNGKKEPHFTDMMNIETELGFYFKK